MPFDTVLGQERAKQVLRRAIRANRIPHALLLTGPDGVGKAALALALARAVNCAQRGEEPCDTCPACHRIQGLTHPDVHVLFPAKRSRREAEDVDPEDERKFLAGLAQDPYRYPAVGPSETLLIDRVRRLEKDLRRGLYEGRCRVAILLETERMRQETANALLKTLEEPLPDTLLILVTSRPNALLPTIRSRCQQLRLRPLAEAEIRQALLRGAGPEGRIALASGLCQGNLRRAHALMGQDVEDLRDQAYSFLNDGVFGADTALVPFVERWSAGGDRKALDGLFDMVVTWLRDIVLFQEGAPHRILHTDRRQEVERLAASVNTEAVSRTLSEIERCRDMSRRNVNASLILISLWRCLRRTSHAA
ncbi:MAG: DNA polymerase III subunit delta' [Candidatus Latescibacteria bacterium]|nr:DNA polymerase III subunit delta' [Candidatus Latescibacterota bacterium]